MKKFATLFAWLVVFVAVTCIGVPATGAEPPQILVGLDAQPIENFARAATLGNALHRYENGPQKNVPMTVWLDKATELDLYSIVQGTKAVEQNVNLSLYDHVVAVGQDDEPDLNRWDANKPNSNLYAPNDVDLPHKNVIGWTRPEVLLARYTIFKSRWPQLPVAVNFCGPSLENVYYKDTLLFHAKFMRASDQQGFDLYPKNNQGDGGHLYRPAYVFDKLKVTGKPLDIYIECSNQKLGRGRGPTASEQGTLFWSALGHGAQRLWYFPQQIGSPFSYNAMSPENEARARDDFAAIKRYMNLVATGVRTTSNQTPKFAVNSDKGTFTWPSTETFLWTLPNESLQVTVDYVGGAAPIITYTGATPSTMPTTAPVVVDAPPVVVPVFPATQPASKELQEIRLIYTDGSTQSFVRKP